MLKIGLTGGIGSGKSVVVKIFQLLDIPVYIADTEAKRIMNTCKTVQKQLISTFGSAVYAEKNKIDRKFLASLIFNNPDALKQINAIVHPAVRNDFQQWCKTQKEAPYVIQESAILFDTGENVSFDKIITVTADESLRIERIISRDHTTKEEILSRIKNQLSDDIRIAQSDFVIYNNTELLLPQVLKIHQELLKL